MLRLTHFILFPFTIRIVEKKFTLKKMQRYNFLGNYDFFCPQITRIYTNIFKLQTKSYNLLILKILIQTISLKKNLLSLQYQKKQT